MQENCVETIRYEILIAGDFQTAKQICRGYCHKVGLCVTVEPVDYIYTGGEEAGVRVRLINYPRFPAADDDIKCKAFALASLLANGLFQHSFTVMNDQDTWWSSSRAALSPSSGNDLEVTI